MERGAAFDPCHASIARRGFRFPDAEVRDGDLRAAILYSVGANGTHGLQRSNEDKRKAVRTLLEDEEWGKWSDREIAKRCAVDHKTVSAARQRLTGEFPQSEGPTEGRTPTGGAT